MKHLRNNGAESIWTQNSVFGPNVVQSVLDGAHYVRFFKGVIFQYVTVVGILQNTIIFSKMLKMKMIWIGNVR